MLHLNIAWQVVYQYKKLNSLDKNCDHFTVYKKIMMPMKPHKQL